MKIRLLEANNLSLFYNKVPILSNISFEIEEGEWVLIQGSCGEGKTTLIKSLLHLHPYEGSIKLKGKEIREYTRKELHGVFSYLPQRITDIPNISVSNFLSLYKENRDRIIGKLNLHPFLDSSLTSLSLGQLQLVLFAQAILEESEIVILDEPFSSIDRENKEIIYSTIKDLSLMGKTIILVSHEVERNYLPDRIITLSNNKSYDSPVLVKQRVNKEVEKLPYVNIKPILVSLFILILLSIFIPSETPYLLRITWCILSGGTFSFIDAVLQSLYKNPIASPNTLGFTSFSLVGNILPSLLGISSFLTNSLSALLTGLFGGFLVNRKKNIVLGILSTTGILLTLLFYSTNNSSYLEWIIGTMDIENYFSLFLIPFILFPLLFMYYKADTITAIGIDKELAQVHGVYTKSMEIVFLMLTIIPIALVVSQTGPVYLIGLVIPYMVMRIYGISLHKVLPAIFLLGSCFTLLADIITRSLNHFTNLMTSISMVMFALSIISFLTYSVIKRK